MLRITIITLVVITLPRLGQAQVDSDLWQLFARVEFESRYDEGTEGYYFFPKFGEEIRSLEGATVELTGYYIPLKMDDGSIILSRNPYSSCFFCGGAGPESVANAIPKSGFPRLSVDEVVKVKGKLRLNSEDVNQLNFILEEATLINE